MNRVILLSLFLSLPVWAKLAKPDWQISSGQLVYHVKFPLKKVDGITKDVKGKGRCDKGDCQFLVAVPVKSFTSGDGNRDNHMLEVTKAALNPMVSVVVKFKEPAAPGEWDATAAVSFAGKTKTYDHLKISSKFEPTKVTTTGKIPLVLSDFEVERPSLLGVAIDDAVPVDFDLTWN